MTGTGGSTNLLANMTDDEILFGGLRTKTGRFLCLMLSGADASGMAKGRAVTHKNAAFNILEGTSGEVCGYSKAEFVKNLASIDFPDPTDSQARIAELAAAKKADPK